MDVGSVSGSLSPTAILTRLAVAAQTSRQAQQAVQSASPAVEAMELKNVQATATGSLDTYA